VRKFIRNKQDFTCYHCNNIIQGNGYTNHCPLCLYSLHVDNNPGDRNQSCKGLMMPVEIITKGGEPHSIVHECLSCKIKKNNIISDLDSINAIIKVMEYKVRQEMMK
jgi:hypothetical protein